MIAQKISFAFFNNMIIHGLGFVSLFFVARYMGPEALGIIAFALAYLKLFGTFTSFGFGSAHIKRVSEGKDLGKCNGTYFSVKLVATVIMAIIVLCTIFVPKFFHHKFFISREHEMVLYIILLSTVVSNISMMFIITFGARKEIAKQQVPLLVEKIIVVAGKVFVALAALGVILLAGANLLGSIVALLCFLYLFRGYPIKKPDKEYFKSYFKFALPVMFMGILSDLAHNMDKVMIQFFWTTADVGYYSAAQRIALFLSYITTASATLIFPTISSYHSKGKIEAIRRFSNQAERYLSMVFFPIMVFICVLSRPICTLLLGQDFLSSAPLLILLAVVMFVNGTSIPYNQQLGGTNRVVLAAKLSAVVFVSVIILNLVFIPREFMGLRLLGLGGVGAAFGTMISMTLGALLFRFYAYKITGSKPNPRVLIHLVSSLIAGSILYFISVSMPIISLFRLILLGFAGAGIYILALTIFREFNKKDLNLFLKILNPLQLKNYAVSEIKGGYIRSTH